MKKFEDNSDAKKCDTDDELEGIGKTVFQCIWIFPIVIGGVFIKFPFFVLGWVVAKFVSGISRLFTRG